MRTNIFKSKINKFNTNYENNQLLSIQKLLKESSNEEEIEKIVNENMEQITSLLGKYNNNIINNIIDMDINMFKIEIDNFIIISKNKIENLKILDDLMAKIRQKIIAYYEIK